MFDKTEILGYGPEKFEFNQNTATLYLNKNTIKNAPKIIEYFKQWIKNTNNIYPEKAKEKIEKEKRVKEQEIEKAIIANKELQQIIKEIKI